MATRERNFGKGVAYTMIVMVVTVVMIVAVLPPLLGGSVRRPEGAAFRFLTGVSTEEESEVADFGDPGLVPSLTDFRRADDDDDWFERVEVGEATRPSADDARVPVLVVRQDADDSADRTSVTATAVLRREAEGSPRDWDVVAIEARDPGTLVPSEGGEHPARAPLGAWVGAALAGVVLTAASAALLRALDRRSAVTAG